MRILNETCASRVLVLALNPCDCHGNACYQSRHQQGVQCLLNNIGAAITQIHNSAYAVFKDVVISGVSKVANQTVLHFVSSPEI